MELRARHLWTDLNDILKSFSSHTELEKNTLCRPSNVRVKNGSLIIPNMLIEHDREFQLLICAVITILGVLGFNLLLHLGVIVIPEIYPANITLQEYAEDFFALSSLVIFFLLVAKYIGEVRYIIIEGDQAIVHTKKRGKWPIPVNDLKFHIIHSRAPEYRYYLEIELPENRFIPYHRMMIIEVAARKETLEEMLAVILPLIHGERGPYDSAPKRRIATLPTEPKPSLWDKWVNWYRHACIWLTMYQFNKILFWLMHGRLKLGEGNRVVIRR